MCSHRSDRIVPIQSEIGVKEAKNYGSKKRPQLTLCVHVNMLFSESPDELHSILIEAGIISRDTIPFEVVTNFRGSVNGKPFYKASIIYRGEKKRYEVNARDTGGLLRTKIYYEPVVSTDVEELGLIHPADFPTRGIGVSEFEMHNYRHHFLLFISSKRYESFDLYVGEAGGKLTEMRACLAETELRGIKPPCDWYVKRMNVHLEGIDLEEEIIKRIRTKIRSQVDIRRLQKYF